MTFVEEKGEAPLPTYYPHGPRLPWTGDVAGHVRPTMTDPLQMARLHRGGLTRTSPSELYYAAVGEHATESAAHVELYRHSMVEAGFMLSKATMGDKPPAVCPICGHDLTLDAIVRDVQAAVAALPKEEIEEYERCLQSVLDARRSANANVGQEWIG